MAYIEDQLATLNKRIENGKHLIADLPADTKPKHKAHLEKLLDVMCRRRRFLNNCMKDRFFLQWEIYDVDKAFKRITNTLYNYFHVNPEIEGEQEQYNKTQEAAMPIIGDKLNTCMDRFDKNYDYENIPQFMGDLTQLQETFAEVVMVCLEQMTPIDPKH